MFVDECVSVEPCAVCTHVVNVNSCKELSVMVCA